MSLFRRHEQRTGIFPEPVIPPIRGMSVFGSTPGGSIAQSLETSAVWACVRLLADTIAMMPVREFTWQGDVRVPRPLSPLLKKPSAQGSMPDWVYQLVASALLRGNAVGVKTGFDATGYPTQVELQNPDDVSIRLDQDTGDVVYRTRKGEVLDSSRVFHMAAYLLPGSPIGLSPISYHARTIGVDLMAGKFALDFFADGAHPTGILESDQPISQEQARTLKERLTAVTRGNREPLVLGAGAKWSAIQVKPEESQFLKTQQYAATQIARVFGVPPEMIGGESGNSMTYANVEQRSIDFLTYSVQPWLTRIEAALSALLPGQRHVRFDTSVLLRTDLETYARSWAIAIAAKFGLPDEARAGAPLDLPPLTEEQKKLLDLIPLTVRPTGLPTAAPGSNAPPAGANAPSATDADLEAEGAAA